MKQNLEIKLNEFENVIREYLSLSKGISDEKDIEYRRKINEMVDELINKVKKKIKFQSVPNEKKEYLKTLVEVVLYDLELAPYFRKEISFNMFRIVVISLSALRERREDFANFIILVNEILKNYKKIEDKDKVIAMIKDLRVLANQLIKKIDMMNNIEIENFAVNDRAFAIALIRLIIHKATSTDLKDKDDISSKFDILKKKLGIKRFENEVEYRA